MAGTANTLRPAPEQFAITTIGVLEDVVRDALAKIDAGSCGTASHPRASLVKPEARPFLTILQGQLAAVEEQLKSGAQPELRIRKLLAIIERLSTVNSAPLHLSPAPRRVEIPALPCFSSTQTLFNYYRLGMIFILLTFGMAQSGPVVSLLRTQIRSDLPRDHIHALIW